MEDRKPDEVPDDLMEFGTAYYKERSAGKGSIFRLLFELDDFHSILILSGAIITSLLSGATLVLNDILLSHFIGTLSLPTDENYIHENLVSFIYLLINFAAAFVLNSLSYYLAKYHGKSLSNHIKAKYFEYVLTQNQSWFDSQNVSEITTRLESNSNSIDYAVRNKP